MPRFAILLKSSPTTEAGILPTGDLLKSMMTYNESRQSWCHAYRLQASSKGARVIFNDSPKVIFHSPLRSTWYPASGFLKLRRRRKRLSGSKNALVWAKAPLSRCGSS
jgi:hypothetical protein